MENSGLTLILLLVAFAAMVAGRMFARYRKVSLRPIPAYVVLPEAAANAVESNTNVHFSMGSSALGQFSTLSAIASAEVIYRLTERLAIGQQTPLVTMSSPLTLPLAQDTLRRAYEYRQRMNRFHSTAAAWFPQGARSFAFAAGASSLAADADVSYSTLLGNFGIEIALLGESALRHDQIVVAHSDRVEGAAIAYAQADHLLIGEELYVGPAYINGRALDVGAALALDLLRWLVILGILVVALQAL